MAPALGRAAPRSVRLRREAWGFMVGSAFFAVGSVPWYAHAVGPWMSHERPLTGKRRGNRVLRPLEDGKEGVTLGVDLPTRSVGEGAPQ